MDVVFRSEKFPISQTPMFAINSTKIEREESKQFVMYNLSVKHINDAKDSNPALIRRRYTDFLDLYNSLKSEQPQLMSSIKFPRKVLMGNFQFELIDSRRKCFEELLQHVVDYSILRNSKSLKKFLTEPELSLAKALMNQCRDFNTAFLMLEKVFATLSKVYTDRSHIVLLCLCRLVGCGAAAPHFEDHKKYAKLALQRYEGVSDSDLLALYVPIMQICIKLDINKEDLQGKLIDLSKSGFAMKVNSSLLHEVDLLEEKLLNY